MVLPVVRSYRLFWLVVLLYAGRLAAQRLLTGAATQKIAVHGKEQVVYIANDKGTIDTKMQVGWRMIIPDTAIQLGCGWYGFSIITYA